MRMGHDNMRDFLFGAHRIQDCLKMYVAFGTRINHGQVMCPNKICIGPAVGHRRRVRGHYAAYANFQNLGNADGGIKIIWWGHRMGLSLGRLGH